MKMTTTMTKKKHRKKHGKHTTEREGRYVPIRTDPENGVIQIHTDGEMPQGENSENKHKRSNRNANRPNRYGSISYKGNFLGMKSLFVLQVKFGTEQKAHPSRYQELYKSLKTFCRTTSSSLRRTPEREEGMLYGSSVNPETDLYRTSVIDIPVYCLQTLDVKLLHHFMLL